MADGMTARTPSLIMALFFPCAASSVTKGRRSLMTRSAAYASSKMHQSGLAGLKRIGAHPSENSHAVSRIGDDGVFYARRIGSAGFASPMLLFSKCLFIKQPQASQTAA